MLIGFGLLSYLVNLVKAHSAQSADKIRLEYIVVGIEAEELEPLYIDNFFEMFSYQRAIEDGEVF